MNAPAPIRTTTGGFGLTVYGCEPDEAEAFEDLASRFGVTVTTVRAVVSEAHPACGTTNRCVSVGHKADISASTLVALQRVGVEHLSTRSIGVNHIDLAAAAELGITVENTTYAPDGVADYTLMLILMAIRNAREVLRGADDHDFRLHRTRGRDLCDMTVGVVGAGSIGSAVIARLRGFGCRVLACNNGLPVSPGATCVSLAALLAESDIVTLHLPLTADTHHIIGRAEIGAMKHGAYLVNTGRGPLVDTSALVDALEAGALGGAASDVLEGEEGIFYTDCRNTEVDHPLLKRLQDLPNAIITPHTAYYTERALRDTVRQTLVKCVNFEQRRAHA